jgi:hypothetical protein
VSVSAVIDAPLQQVDGLNDVDHGSRPRVLAPSDANLACSFV